jgi:nitrite reductase/ring-hydroxylating ferredoxin subunit
VTEDTLWLPVAGAADLPAGGLLPVRALGRDIVVWRTAAGVLAAAHDRCPHRGTPLSGLPIPRLGLRAPGALHPHPVDGAGPAR